MVLVRYSMSSSLADMWLDLSATCTDMVVFSSIRFVPSTLSSVLFFTSLVKAYWMHIALCAP